MHAVPAKGGLYIILKGSVQKLDINETTGQEFTSLVSLLHLTVTNYLGILVVAASRGNFWCSGRKGADSAASKVRLPNIHISGGHHAPENQ